MSTIRLLLQAALMAAASLAAASALAQESHASGKGNGHNPSIQDTLKQREALKQRLSEAGGQGNTQNSNAQNTNAQNPGSQSTGSKPAQHGGYGLGIDARKVEKAETPTRPDRPARPQIERPGRP